MIKKIAWDTFKNTGDINAFLELKQIENLEKEMDYQESEQEMPKMMDFNLENEIENKNQKVD